MNLCFKKAIIVFCLAFVFFVQDAFTQDSCYNCSIDSLTQTYQQSKADAEKIRLLTQLVDLRLIHSNIHQVNENSLKDDSTANYIRSLIDLSKSQKVDNIDAYKNVLDAFIFFNNDDFLNGQNSLKKAIALFDINHKKITYLLFFTRLSYNFGGNQEDRFKYYSERLKYYLANGPVENVASCYHCLAGYYLYKADYNNAISNYLRAAAVYKNFDKGSYRNDLNVAGYTYADWGNYEKAEEYFNLLIPLNKIAKDSFSLPLLYINLSANKRSQGNYEEALRFADTSLLFNHKQFPDMKAMAYMEKSFSFIRLNKLNEAYSELGKASKIADSNHTKLFSAWGAFELDFGYYQYYSAIKKYDEGGKYLLSAYQKSIVVKSNKLQLKYLKELSLFYGEESQPMLAFTYTKKFYHFSDSLDKQRSAFKVAQYENEEKEIRQNDSLNVLKQQGAIQKAIIKKNNLLLWGSLGALILISMSLFFVYRQYRMNKKTLLSLRKTQRQLIMAEKMASLGELTAGIAHEIQNPLNFVNNFSEVNTELIDELTNELNTSNKEEAISIAKDIKENEEKINHHGKRADAIVKGMLQHSRSSTGVKELTDINALADEYLRLSYHGLRAKDKSFNAIMKTDFDNSIGKINIIPQDIGRVLLNLYNNAFYAVNEKGKQQPNGYEPTISMSTKKINNTVGLTVKDNGNGIPTKIADKIFQPFFTTKPTGEGTGLGLSLSYDIIKAHGGEIKVETKEGEGTAFIIHLPV
jgi:two-component system, NtrC family, sensor kinase